MTKKQSHETSNLGSAARSDPLSLLTISAEDDRLTERSGAVSYGSLLVPIGSSSTQESPLAPVATETATAPSDQLRRSIASAHSYYDVPVKFDSSDELHFGSSSDVYLPTPQPSFPSYSDDGDDTDVAATADMGEESYGYPARSDADAQFQWQQSHSFGYPRPSHLGLHPRDSHESTEDEDLAMIRVWDADTAMELNNPMTSSEDQPPLEYGATALSLEDLDLAFANAAVRAPASPAVPHTSYPQQHHHYQQPSLPQQYDMGFPHQSNVHPLKRDLAMSSPLPDDVTIPTPRSTLTPTGRHRPPPYAYDNHRRANSDTPPLSQSRSRQIPSQTSRLQQQQSKLIHRGTSTPPSSRFYLPLQQRDAYQPQNRSSYRHQGRLTSKGTSHDLRLATRESGSSASKDLPPPPPPPPPPPAWQYQPRRQPTSSRTDPLRSHKRYHSGSADPYSSTGTASLRPSHRSGSWSNLTLAYDAGNNNLGTVSDPATWRSGGHASTPTTPTHAAVDRKMQTLGTYLSLQQHQHTSLPHHRRAGSRAGSVASTAANSVATDRSHVSHVSDTRHSEYFSSYNDKGIAQLSFPVSRVHLVVQEQPPQSTSSWGGSSKNLYSGESMAREKLRSGPHPPSTSPWAATSAASRAEAASENDALLGDYASGMHESNHPNMVPWRSPFTSDRREEALRPSRAHASWPWRALDSRSDGDEISDEDNVGGASQNDPLPVGQLFQVAIPHDAYENYHMEWEDELDEFGDEDGDGVSLDFGGPLGGTGCRHCRYRRRHQLPPCYYAMAVPDDLYRRVLNEVVLSRRMPCRLFFCGQYEDVDRPSIGIAVAVVIVLLLLMGVAAWSVQS